VNKRQKQVLFSKLQTFFGGNLQGKTIAVWGLAFKPNTDDMREASSIPLLESIWAAGGGVRAYDPVAMNEARRIFGDRTDYLLCASAEEAIEGADALVIVTEWREFRSPDFELIKATLRHPVIFDGRNIYEPSKLRELGIAYFGIGRGESTFRREGSANSGEIGLDT
jgi:UDPglucose 6-dehydrogenase